MSEKDSDSSSNHIDNTRIPGNGSNGKQLQRQFRQVSKILFIGLVLAIAPVVFMSSNMLYVNGNSNGYLAFGQSEDNDDDNAGETITLPQPNDNDTLINVEASNALFEPAAGLSNVFGPGGLFPFDNFNCADALTCGVSAGENAEFSGTFEKGNINNLTSYEATYTSPVTYGPHQIAGNEYKITLTDVTGIALVHLFLQNSLNLPPLQITWVLTKYNMELLT